jgi:hypothetical protein
VRATEWSNVCNGRRSTLAAPSKRIPAKALNSQAITAKVNCAAPECPVRNYNSMLMATTMNGAATSKTGQSRNIRRRYYRLRQSSF